MATTPRPKATIVQNEENPEPLHIIAKAIIDVAEAFDKISKSPLSTRAIVLLIEDMIPANKRVYKKDIETILLYAPLLKSQYIKSPTKKPVRK